jgi:hypothetical protein
LGILISASAGAAQSSVRVPSEAPGTFITRILKEEIHGEWALQWRELHPGHRALITRAQYVACSRGMGTDFATGKEIFRVLDVRDEPIHVRGVPQRTSKLVTITFRQPSKSNGLTYHLHAVAAANRWVWILGSPFLSKLAQGRCLDGSRLVSTA